MKGFHVTTFLTILISEAIILIILANTILIGLKIYVKIFLFELDFIFINFSYDIEKYQKFFLEFPLNSSFYSILIKIKSDKLCG